MARVGKYLHDSLVAGSTATTSNAFDKAEAHEHTLKVGGGIQPVNFYGVLEGVMVRVTNTAGLSGAPKVTMRVTLDANGDYSIIPDTEADLVPGLTTTTAYCASFKVGVPVFQILGGQQVYVHIKLDQGTANFPQSCVTWSE